MIPVTKPYLPDRAKLTEYLDGIYERQWLTNNGKLVQELTRRLEEYLGVENLLLVANGTLALQIAYRTLGVTAEFNEYVPEAITTPFTFVATASSLKWDGTQPVFADIDPETWCLNPDNIETLITPRTRAVVPVHVFGNACEVEAIDEIATRNHLKVIYDAAHAFAVNYKGESLLKWGDAATLSFHATKVFHTAEGGAIIFRRKEDLERARKLINFGITGPESIETLGINAKMSELQAAIGLCLLDEMKDNLQGRADIWHTYKTALRDRVQLQKLRLDTINNFGYFPIVLESEQLIIKAIEALKKIGVSARRYFYPSLDSLTDFQPNEPCRISRNLASRILCLPIYCGLDRSKLSSIIDIIQENCAYNRNNNNIFYNI